MRHPIAFGLLVCLTVLLCPTAHADPPVASPAEILQMMDTQPAVEYGKIPHPWSKVGQAAKIAQAVASVAETRQEAAELVVFAIREGGNRLEALGDGGHSHGPWQLDDRKVSPRVATDPVGGAKAWLRVAADSRAACADLSPDEQLAALASGDCHRGLRLVRHRAHLARVALGLEPLVVPLPQE